MPQIARPTKTIATGFYRNGGFGVNAFVLQRKDGGYIARDCHADGVWFGRDFQAAKAMFLRIARDNMERGNPVSVTTRTTYDRSERVRGMV